MTPTKDSLRIFTISPHLKGTTTYVPTLMRQGGRHTMNKHMKWATTATAFGLLLDPVTMEASQSDEPEANSSMSSHQEEMNASVMMAE